MIEALHRVRGLLDGRRDEAQASFVATPLDDFASREYYAGRVSGLEAALAAIDVELAGFVPALVGGGV